MRASTVAMSADLLLRGQLKFLQRDFDVIASASGKDLLSSVGARENVRVQHIHMLRRINLVVDFFSFLRLIVFFLNEKPIIVHSITPKAGLLAMVASKIAGVPIRIHSFTGLVFPTQTGLKKMLLIFMDRFLCYCATDVYPEGLGVKKDLIRFNITKKPIKVIANGSINGVDIDYFSPNNLSVIDNVDLRSHLGIGTSDFIFLFVGRLVRDKGVQELVEAFTRIPTLGCHLILVGNLEQDLDPISSHIIQEIRTNIRIHFVGYQSDIRPFLSISNCFVLPSYREGFPNVLLQAGAMKIPSIVSDVNGSNEIIIDGLNGFILKKNSTEELLQVMTRAIFDKELCFSLGDNARCRVEKLFTNEIVWNALRMEYDYLLMSKGIIEMVK